MESFLSGERTNNFQWCPVKMASCTFVPILSNNTEKELYSIVDYRYNYTTAGCADILFMGSIEYVLGLLLLSGHVDKNSQHVYLQQKERVLTMDTVQSIC